jgi:hypothetical protein
MPFQKHNFCFVHRTWLLSPRTLLYNCYIYLRHVKTYIRTGTLKAKLTTGKFKAHQYRHKSGYVATPTAGTGWKSNIPEGHKWQTANFRNMNGLPCGLAKMQNWRPRNTVKKPLKWLKTWVWKIREGEITRVNTANLKTSSEFLNKAILNIKHGFYCWYQLSTSKLLTNILHISCTY